MKVKNVNLEYNVLVYDWNSKKVENYNVMHILNLETIRKKILKREITNYGEFKEYLRKEFMYRFWSKREYEILVGDLNFDKDTFEKIDAYRPIEMNLDLIAKYVINEMQIKFYGGKDV